MVKISFHSIVVKTEHIIGSNCKNKSKDFQKFWGWSTPSQPYAFPMYGLSKKRT